MSHFRGAFGPDPFPRAKVCSVVSSLGQLMSLPEEQVTQASSAQSDWCPGQLDYDDALKVTGVLIARFTPDPGTHFQHAPWGASESR